MGRGEGMEMLDLRPLWLAGLAMSAAPAAAFELSELVPEKDGAVACWSRLYDAAHLKAHPDQQVGAMGFSISYAAETAEFAEQYSFLIEARMRNGDVGYNTGPCYENEGQIICGVECDGGSVMVRPASDDGSVFLDLETSGYIWLSGGCGVDDGDGDGGFALESGLDDKRFLLGPMGPGTCEPPLLD
jgi:hypothetical protein